MKELMYIRSFSKRHLSVIMGTLLLVIIGSVWLNTAPFRSGFEITDELGGNIFPSSILSVATTDAQVIVPSAPRITLIIRKFYKKHPEKYPLFTFPGVFCLFCCRNSRLTFYF